MEDINTVKYDGNMMEGESIVDFLVPKEIKNIYEQYYTLTIRSFILAALFLVTLSWNDAIQTIINYYYPNSDIDTISEKIYYALTVTIFVVFLQIYVFPYLYTEKEINIIGNNEINNPQLDEIPQIISYSFADQSS